MYVVLRDLHFRISPLFGQNKKRLKLQNYTCSQKFIFSCFLQKVSCAPTMQTVSWTRNRRNLAFTQNFCFDGCGSQVPVQERAVSLRPVPHDRRQVLLLEAQESTTYLNYPSV